jgi:hypothetical protein
MILCISNALLTCEMLKRLLLCIPNTDMFVLTQLFVWNRPSLIFLVRILRVQPVKGSLFTPIKID